MDYRKEIKEFIVENFLFGEESELNYDTDFYNSGIVDSTGVLEIICFLEENYPTIIEDDEVTQQNFSSINSVNSYLQKKLSQSNKAS